MKLLRVEYDTPIKNKPPKIKYEYYRIESDPNKEYVCWLGPKNGWWFSDEMTLLGYGIHPVREGELMYKELERMRKKLLRQPLSKPKLRIS